mmetsp:Transcript_18873/g.47877  ORF Transcript_18873/g.47877 Transcript_18873/m.47877 type:complete len:225 (-) Transcript_18873:4340-5014(-)
MEMALGGLCTLPCAASVLSCSNASLPPAPPAVYAATSSASAASALASASLSASARRYSRGNTFLKCTFSLSQLIRMRRATSEPVNLRWRWIMDLSTRTSSANSTGNRSSLTSLLHSDLNWPWLSYTYAMPPLMPAPKFLPVPPRMTATPPVMYSQAWSPTPSTTARAPELRTQKRSAAMPRKYASPLTAPYSATLPMMMFSSGLNLASLGGYTATMPPLRPLPT